MRAGLNSRSPDRLAEAIPEAPRSGALDLHEGISHPAPLPGCARWPKRLRLLGSNGALVPGRCRSTNLCDYCARLGAVEVSEMLALDAMKGNAPQVWCVLTTRAVEPDPAVFYDGRRLVMRAIKRRWPGAEYVCLVEFTTGYGPRSGGARRPHWNLLLKGVPATAEALQELEGIIARVWCTHVDAKPAAQFAGIVEEVGGLMRYLALHFLKESQRPPAGWRGHRVTASHGYYGEPRWKVRREAQESLRLKRAIRRHEHDGHEGHEAVLLAEADRLRAESVQWECVVLTVDEMTGEVTRLRPLHGGEVTTWRQRRQRDLAAEQNFASIERDALGDHSLLTLQLFSAIREWQRERDSAQLTLVAAEASVSRLLADP
jgi:hypothetical protein